MNERGVKKEHITTFRFLVAGQPPHLFKWFLIIRYSCGVERTVLAK
jgi:hypothetical protein